jgi:hypothetical protein
MGRIAFVYGAIAGAIAVGAIVAGFFFGSDHGGQSLWFGYLIMIVALTMIFLGVKRYRDRTLGGVIKFGPAFLLGLAIAAIAGVFYAIGWEGYLAATGHKFIEDYAAGVLEAKKAAGVTGEALQAEIAKLDLMKTNYANPLFRLPMTFIEIFPVGVVIALISAALLRNPKVLPAR